MTIQQQSSAGTPLKRADIRWIRMYLRRQLLLAILFEGIFPLTAHFHFTVHCTVMSSTHILNGVSSDQVNMSENTPRSPPNLSAFSFLHRPEGKAQAPTKHSRFSPHPPRYISTSHGLSFAPRMPQQNKRPRRVTASSFALLRLTFSLGPATLPAAELSRACALLGTWSSAIATLVSVHLCWMRC